MSRAVANATLYAAVSNGFAKMMARRSFLSAAGAAASVTRRRPGAAGLMRGDDKAAKSIEVGDGATSWVPDPVTGYYRPANRGNEVDVAELRNLLLNNKH